MNGTVRPQMKYFARIDMQKIRLTVKKTRSFLVHCTAYHMVADGKQKNSIGDETLDWRQ